MIYVNQLDYPNMEYITKLEIPDADTNTTVKSSGCPETQGITVPLTLSI